MSHLSRWRTVADVMCHFKLPWKCPLTSEVWLHQHIRLKLRYIKYRLSLLCGSFIFIIPWLYKTCTFVAVYNIAVHLLCSINLWLLVFYFYQILNAFNKLKMTSEAVLLLPNTDCLQQVEDYVGGYTWQLKRVKTIYRFYKLLFHRRDSIFECLNRVIHNNGLWYLSSLSALSWPQDFMRRKSQTSYKKLTGENHIYSDHAITEFLHLKVSDMF